MGNHIDSFELTTAFTSGISDLLEAVSTRTVAILEKESPNFVKTKPVSSISLVLLQTSSWCSLKMFPEHILLRAFEMQMVS